MESMLCLQVDWCPLAGNVLQRQMSKEPANQKTWERIEGIKRERERQLERER